MGFKQFIEAEEEKESKVKNLLGGQNFIMFFTTDSGNSVFGAPENSRVVFARMKNPDSETDGLDDANFMAVDLIKALMGQKVQNMFGNKDLSKIKIIDKDVAEKKLLTHPAHKMNLKIKQDKDGVGMIKLKDKK